MAQSIRSEQTLVRFTVAFQGTQLELTVDPTQRGAEFSYKSAETQVRTPILLTDLAGFLSFFTEVNKDTALLALVASIQAEDEAARAAAEAAAAAAAAAVIKTPEVTDPPE